MLSRTLGRWDDAERQFRAALARDPLNTYVIFNLGSTYYGAGRFAEAEAHVSKVARAGAGLPVDSHSCLGKTLLAQGKPEAALAMVQQEADEAIRLMVSAGRLAGSRPSGRGGRGAESARLRNGPTPVRLLWP